LKIHHLFPSGYSFSEEEEKVIILNIKTFPSFLKEWCHPPVSGLRGG
jgi:hypothetical protein